MSTETSIDIGLSPAGLRQAARRSRSVASARVRSTAGYGPRSPNTLTRLLIATDNSIERQRYNIVRCNVATSISGET